VSDTDDRHPTFQWLGSLRPSLRTAAFTSLQQAFGTDDGRRILADALEGTGIIPVPTATDPPPYPELGRATADPPRGTVFITGRFRSGSTLLWNLFRHVPGCTAYYEPLNERRWFDPALRGNRIDSTHLGVSDYWREYEGLTHLGQWYQPRWIDRHLYMDERAFDPNLASYIQALINAAESRAVLQFNRVDLRLPWLRRNFPGARLIHLFRHPRDQWCSSLTDVQRFPRDGSVQEFEAHDHFYLLAWARDLSYQFPFLDPRHAEHPYDLFYLIWKLSYLFGQRYSDASFSFEQLCQSPDTELHRFMRAANIDDYDMDALKKLIVPQKSKWQQFADQHWFERREARCETILSRFVGS
jgi:hypothetical protein